MDRKTDSEERMEFLHCSHFQGHYLAASILRHPISQNFNVAFCKPISVPKYFQNVTTYDDIILEYNDLTINFRMSRFLVIFQTL